MIRRPAGLVLLAFAGARLAALPRGCNTHAIMYAIVAEAGGRNTLELFHPLHVPLLAAVGALWRGAGLPAPALPAFQALSLFGAFLNIWLTWSIAEKAGLGRRGSLIAAVLAAWSVNLWCWSLQTMPYTLATAAMLGVVRVLLEPSSLATAAAAGALAGLGASFDTAAAVMLPVAAAELWFAAPRETPAARAGACAAAFTAVLASSYGLYLFVGASLPSGLGDMLAKLPEDIDSIFKTRSVAAQLRGWAASEAPTDAPFAVLALLHGAAAAYGWKRRDAAGTCARAAALAFVGVAVFFLLADPHNRFIYASALFWPLLAAGAIDRQRRLHPFSALALLGGALALRVAASPPDYLPSRTLPFDEARFLRSRLGPRDMIVAVSEPDWVFAFLYGRRSPIVRPDWPEEPLVRFGQERLPAAALARRAAEASCAGGTVVVAADALFRDSGIDPDEMDSRAHAIAASLAGRFELRPAWISPLGQRYVPLRLRSRASCGPRIDIISSR